MTVEKARCFGGAARVASRIAGECACSNTGSRFTLW